MIVDRLAAMCLRQTVRTVPFREGESTGTVYGNQKVMVEQPITIQHLLSDQGLDHTADHFLHLGWVQARIECIHCVPVGATLHAEQRLELGRRGTIATEHMIDLPAGSQATQKHQYASIAHRCQWVGDEVRITRVVDWVKEITKVSEEMPSRLQARIDDR